MGSATRRPVTAAKRIAAAVALAISASVLAASMPVVASAHPLGNFTINRYNGLAVGPDWIQLDRVVDMAELPTVQARQQMDANGDGGVADAEAAAWARQACRDGASELGLKVAGQPVALSATRAGLAFTAGQAGLLTLRHVCTYEATGLALSAPADLTFDDGSFAGRQGWQEITVTGVGVYLGGGEAFAAGRSDRLRAYPTDGSLASQSRVSVLISGIVQGSGGQPPAVTDAVPLDSPDKDIIGVAAAGGASAVRDGIAELPGELSAIFGAADLGLPALALALLVATLLGAFHAATPGHGKTLMAAYLVGSRGTARHAVGLGITVTISHTIGVLVLGAIVLVADAAVPSERLLPALGLASGLVVTALGAVFLGQRVRARRHSVAHAHEHPHPHAVGHPHPHPHAHGDDHEHDHAHDHPHDPGIDQAAQDAAAGWHSHGPLRHTHLPAENGPLRRRNLVALGVVGGLVPSASAILILVGAIAAGRPALGMVLTVAFGLGMAVVLVGVGMLVVRARALVERMPMAGRLDRVLALAPVITALTFIVVGVAITVQAGSQLR
jgi:nickel/cobalt transporter (NicO) family protein